MPAGYDAWKTTDPRDWYGRDDLEYNDYCDHVEFDVDILDGRARCDRCGETWCATQAQIDAEIERLREHDEWQRHQGRREFWRKLTLPIRWPLFRFLEKVWPKKSCSVLTDDEIPF